jgi:hypothetical protein
MIPEAAHPLGAAVDAAPARPLAVGPLVHHDAGAAALHPVPRPDRTPPPQLGLSAACPQGPVQGYNAQAVSTLEQVIVAGLRACEAEWKLLGGTQSCGQRPRRRPPELRPRGGAIIAAAFHSVSQAP